MRNAADNDAKDRIDREQRRVYVTPDLFAEYRDGEDLPKNPQPSMHELSLGYERLPIRPRHLQDRG